MWMLILSLALAGDLPRNVPGNAGPPRLPRPSPAPPGEVTRTLPGYAPGAAAGNVAPAEGEEVPFDALQVTDRVDPGWPAGVRDVDLAQCSVRVWIDANGNPTRAEPFVCDQRFSNVASAAVMKWRFRPYEVDGEAVPVVTTIPLEFRRR